MLKHASIWEAYLLIIGIFALLLGTWVLMGWLSDRLLELIQRRR